MNTQTIFMCVVALLIGVLVANMLQNVCGCKKVEGFGILTADGGGINGGLGRSDDGQNQITGGVLKNFINMTNQRFNEYNPPDDDSGFACGGYAGSTESLPVSQAVEDLRSLCLTTAVDGGGYDTDAFNQGLSTTLTAYESRLEDSVCKAAKDFDSSDKIEEACNSLP